MERAVVSVHPPESHLEFKSGDKVDAFHDHQWWEGDVIEDLGKGEIVVCLRESKEEMAFPKELLRTHREWMNNNWVPPISNSNSNRDRDMISDLPDAVLLHMMNNFMDTKDAVQTCVLSKRWKHLCKRLTTLRCSPPLVKEHEHDQFGFPKRVEFESFKKFASWILTARDDSCSLLNLTIVSWTERELLDKVVEYAVFHKVQQLTLHTRTDLRHLSPNCDSLLPLIFSCQSLTSLDLCNPSKVIILPTTLHLPALQTLHLDSVILTATHNNASVEPFSNCLVLNTLVLVDCSLHSDDAQVLCISNYTLSNLTIYGLQANQIVLSTPNLSSFTIMGSYDQQLFSTCNLSFLEQVNIDACLGRLDGNSSSITRWLQPLASVKRLTLSSFTILLIHAELSNPISRRPQPLSFVRLESLKVNQHSFKICNEELNTALEYLLQNSPMARVDIIAEAYEIHS